MSALAKLLYQNSMREAAQEGDARDFARRFFIEWRDRYVASLCAYIRVYGSAEMHRITLPEPFRDRDWCNAAVQILTNCSEDIQDCFLRAGNSTKTAMVDAVLADGGVYDLNDHFQPLPVL